MYRMIARSGGEDGGMCVLSHHLNPESRRVARILARHFIQNVSEGGELEPLIINSVTIEQYQAGEWTGLFKPALTKAGVELLPINPEPLEQPIHQIRPESHDQ